MNFDRVIKSLLSNPAATGLAGAVAGGLLVSDGGRKLGKKALELGGMAALAGLAYTAWQRHQSRGEAVESPSPAQLRDAGFLPKVSHTLAGDDLGTVLFRAMVAAARCDGRLDVGERRALFEQIEKLKLPEAERAELFAQIERPASLDEVISSATTPQRALEIYTASRVAIEPDSPAERGYLALLAARLGLEDALVAEIEQSVSAEQAATVASVSVAR
jgi:uncharacterized membrane protein YebE (DUF533 family)